MSSKMNRIVPAMALVVALLAGATAQSADVLMVNIDGGYDNDAQNLFQTIVAAGANATYVHLNSDGLAAAELAAGSFDQVWVFDLSTGADSYPTDYQAIADWYNQQMDPQIICDGRMISSYWNGRWQGEGMALSENYYHNLDLRGGGLVLTTDHAPYQGGINEINALIGIQPFVGSFYLNTIPVDVDNPLMNTPNDLGTTLYDDSSPGQTPYGLQPNGAILYTVAWHSGNPDTPGISSTIEGTVGMHVEITAPLDGSVFAQDDLITFSAEVTGGDEPYTFTWTYDGGTPLGADPMFTVAAEDLPVGEVTITVLVEDDFGRDDDDSVVITILPNAAPVCQAGVPLQGDAGVPLQFDGSGSYDTDGTIVSYLWDFGDGNSGTGVAPVHTYEQDGDYIVTLCVTDDDGATTCCSPGEPTVQTEPTHWDGLKALYR